MCNRKSFAALGLFVSLFSVGGCVIYPHSERDILAVRYGIGTNVAEKLVLLEKQIQGWEIFGPAGGGGFAMNEAKYRYYVEDASGRRTDVTCPGLTEKEELRRWYVWPVGGTSRWVAIQPDDHGLYGTNHGETNVLLHLCVFSTSAILRQKELTVFVPANQDIDIPDFRFDASYRDIVYRLTNGYAMYDLLEDASHPCAVPDGKKALALINNGRFQFIGKRPEF